MVHTTDGLNEVYLELKHKERIGKVKVGYLWVFSDPINPIIQWVYIMKIPLLGN